MYQPSPGGYSPQPRPMTRTTLASERHRQPGGQEGMTRRPLASGPQHTALLYTDPRFAAASDLARELAQKGRVSGLLGALARQPLAVLQILLAVRRLPVLEVAVNARQAATWFSPEFPPV